MDQQDRLIAASVVKWSHDGKLYSEELRPNKRSSGPVLSLVDRIMIASWPLEDIDPDETTRIWFGGRMHVITEAQLHELSLSWPWVRTRLCFG
ncbi:MAG: hypothetical protein AAGJ50_03775 [Pseudomonadota bacterium]